MEYMWNENKYPFVYKDLRVGKWFYHNISWCFLVDLKHVSPYKQRDTILDDLQVTYHKIGILAYRCRFISPSASRLSMIPGNCGNLNRVLRLKQKKKNTTMVKTFVCPCLPCARFFFQNENVMSKTNFINS